MKLILTYIFLLFFASVCLAEELHIVESKITEFPERNVNFYYYGNDFNLLDSINIDDLEFKYNDIIVNSFNLNNPVKIVPTPLSIVFSIDISENNRDNLPKIESTILSLEKYLDFENIEFAIQAYNSSSYILVNFTSDFENIRRALGTLETFGFSNFNTAFTNNNSGSIDIARKSDNNSIIINFAAGNAIGDSNAISNKANSFNISINNILINQRVPSILKNISERTNGISESTNSDVELLTFLLKIINKGLEIDTFELTFEDLGCDSVVNLSLNLNSKNVSDGFIAHYSKNKLPFIELEPKFIDFGIVENGESEIEPFILTARNNDIELENILPNYPELRISPKYENVLLEKNSPKAFNIEYNSKTTDYYFKQIEIVSNTCKELKLDVFAGKKEGDVNSSELVLKSPNGGELFYSGQIIDIVWDGVLTTQEVIIEYSTDGGSNWSTISNNATGKSYEWIIPDFQSDKMLVKVEIANGNLSYQNVSYVRDIDEDLKATNVELSMTNKFAGVSFDDGSIFVWNLDSNKIETQLRNKNPGVQTTDIAFGSTSNLFAAAFGKENEFDVVVWDIDNIANTVSRFFSSAPTKLEWSDNGTSLIIGFENGDIVEWDMANSIINSILNMGDRITDIAFNSENDIIVISTDNKILMLDDDFARNDSIVLTGIKDIDWSKGGNKLSVAYQSSDLRLYNLENNGGEYVLNFRSRINRPEQTDILKSSWVNDNSLVIISEDNRLVEYWGTDATKLFDFDLHSDDLNLLSSNGKQIISAVDTNFALVWDIDDYPFGYDILDSDESDNNWSIVKKALQVENQDFGILCLNTFYNFNFPKIIKNLNNPSITIDSIVPLSKDITVNNSFPIALDKDESLDLSVNYIPKNLGPFQHTVYIYYGANKEKLILNSNNKNPEYNILNKHIEFNNTIINSKKTKKVEILLNNNNSKINFDEIDLVFGNEYFEIENINSLELENNQKLVLDISYQPKDEENINGLIKLVSEDLCSNIYITLIGNGIKNNLSYTNDVEFGNLTCNNIKDTLITVKNFSLDMIDIISANIKDNVGNAYSIISDDLPKLISIGDSANIRVEFNSLKVGEFNSILEITTNLTGPSNKLEIGLKTVRDTINLDLVDDKLDFGTVGLNEKGNKTIRVLNKSLIDFVFPENFIFKEFRLINAMPSTIAKGDTSTLEFEFSGQSVDTTISTDMEFIEGCNSKFIIPMIVDVSNGRAKIEVAEKLDFGEIICDSIVIFDVRITNNGQGNLKLSDIDLEGINSSQFATLMNYQGLTIQPNNSEIIQITYTPSDIGEIKATLIINSNAENSNDGITKIPIELLQNSTKLLLLSNNVKFEGLKSNRKYSKEIRVRNIGNKAVVPFFRNDIRFYVDSIRPKIILPGEESIIYLSFVGGEPETNYLGVIEIVDECNNKYIINLEANVGGSDFVSIKPENIESKTGKMINLNISFENSTGVTIPDNDTIKTKLIFNSTLLVPLDDKYKGQIDGNGMRVINLEFPLKDKEFIYHIPVIVTLGDTSYSEIRLEQSTHLNNNFYIDDVNTGSILVTNIVTQPKPRYIDGNGKQYMSETIPSPIVESGIINYGIIESTNVKITLYDILGNEIRVLVDKHHIPGEYTIQINPQFIPSGNYLYKLETPSMEIIKKMTIIK